MFIDLAFNFNIPVDFETLLPYKGHTFLPYFSFIYFFVYIDINKSFFPLIYFGVSRKSPTLFQTVSFVTQEVSSCGKMNPISHSLSCFQFVAVVRALITQKGSLKISVVGIAFHLESAKQHTTPRGGGRGKRNWPSGN